MDTPLIEQATCVACAVFQAITLASTRGRRPSGYSPRQNESYLISPKPVWWSLLLAQFSVPP